MDLGRTAAREGFRLQVHDSLGSTNDEAARLAREGDPGPIWVVAHQQTSGRGRSGRVWASPPGNLYASLLLVDPCSMAVAPQLGFVASVALHKAISSLTGFAGLRLKWPNDLLLGGAKTAGILVEGLTIGQRQTPVAVIGIGVNVAHHPADLPYPAADLCGQGASITAALLFAALSDAMVETLATWRRGAGFAAIRDAWLARAGGLGQPIAVRQSGAERRGIFVDLDGEGRLLLAEGDRVLPIAAGDVFFLPRPDAATGTHA